MANITDKTNLEDFVDEKNIKVESFKETPEYLKISENGILIRNFIPCYRKSDNEIGLYDIVNNVFYTNQGTGEFLKGSNAPTPSVPIEIESVGDLITDTNDINYGKYKIPVTVNNITTNIYLNEPLRKIGDFADYLDYKNGKVVRNTTDIMVTDLDNIQKDVNVYKYLFFN